MSRFNKPTNNDGNINLTPTPTTPNTPPRQTQIVTPTNPIAKHVEHQQTLLNSLDATMDRVGDEFADRAVEIIEKGIQSGYNKAFHRIQSIELPFFDWAASGSFFGQSTNENPFLNQTHSDVIEVAALPASEN